MSETTKNTNNSISSAARYTSHDDARTTINNPNAPIEQKDFLAEKQEVLAKLDRNEDLPASGKYGLIGLLSGVKSATATAIIEDKDIAVQGNPQVERILDDLGLHYVTEMQSLGTDPRYRPNQVWLCYYVAKTKDQAELTKKVLEQSRAENQAGEATRQLGRLFGYPQTAIDYYVQKNQHGRVKNHRSQPKYHSYVHSPDHAEQEYQQYEQRIDAAFRQYCPESADEFFQKVEETWQTHHRKRTASARVQRFLDLAQKLGREGAADESLDEIMQRMSPQDVLNLLQHINSQLRNQKIAPKSEVYGDKTQRITVYAGDAFGEKALIAPEPELQEELFSKYFQAIKKIKDKDKKAALAYYAINSLHLFEDGNGRTARAMYLLLKNGNIADADDIITHISKTGRDAGRENFLRENCLQSREVIGATANEFVQAEMIQNGELDRGFANTSIYLQSWAERGGLVDIMMSEQQRENLSAEELRCLGYAVSEGAGENRMSSTISGLTIAIVLTQKGAAAPIITQNTKNDGTLPITVNFDERENTATEIASVQNTFANWTLDDYRQTIASYQEIKRRQDEMIIKFFTEDVRFDGGQSVADWAMGKL